MSTMIVYIILTISIIAMGLAVGYSYFVAIGHENFKGITVVLDKVYNNTSDMAYAVRDELENKGKQCEIVELGDGYPKLSVDGKKYVAVGKVASMEGFPVQVIQLKVCKQQ